MFRIPEKLLNEIKKVIPVKKYTTGRPQSDIDQILNGIFYVIRNGNRWSDLPICYGPKSTVHGKFMALARSGVFEKILQISIEFAVKNFCVPECFFIDTTSSKAPFAKFGGKNPTDRGKNGIKKSVVIDKNRIVLSIILDAANVHDSKLLKPHVKNLKPYLATPKVMIADSAWDINYLRKSLAKDNIALLAATNVRRDKNKKIFTPWGRWRIEQIFGIQQWNRGIKFCWTKTAEAFLALCQFASAVQNFKLVGVFG